MAEIELKPCPFCGGKPEKRTFINSAGIYVYRVYCPQCQIGTMKHNSMKIACETWNRRNDDDTAEWIDKEVRGTMTNVCSVCGSCSVYPDKYCGGCGSRMKNGY